MGLFKRKHTAGGTSCTDDGTLAPEQICRRYSSNPAKSLFIRRDFTLFVCIDNLLLRNEPVADNYIVIETVSYDIIGTYIASTQSGVLLKDWAIRKGIQR